MQLTLKPNSKEPAIQHLRKEATAAGATFTGDTSGGTCVAWGVELTYSVSGDTVTINIVKKPFIMPKSVIENKIKGFLAPYLL